MNKEEDYGSDSEESDEDFCPTGEHSDAGSEEDSEEVSEAENHDEEEGKKAKSPSTKRNKRTKACRKSVKKSKVDNSSEEEENVNADASSRRQTRRGEATTSKKSIEKVVIESDEEEKGRSDSLWAAFMSDVKPPSSSSKAASSTKAKSTETSSSSSTSSAAKTENGTDNSEKKTLDKEKSSEEVKVASPSLVTVTEVVDFAGEAVSIQKTVKADSIKENQSSASKTNPAKPIPPTLKRPAMGGIGVGGGGGGGAGLGSILNQIGKKKKISVLEKSKLDWSSFKQTEGIEEQLQTFNKGKDGYLERQDFLQRTDLRQFEIEKSLRQSRRN